MRNLVKEFIGSYRGKLFLSLFVSTLIIFGLLAYSPVAPKSLQTILRLGFEGGDAYAGTPDYWVDGTDDDVQVRAAIDALPSTGGKLILYGGNWDFHDNVTRAINNVTIEGSGYSCNITTAGTQPPFICTGQSGWLFSNFSCDEVPAYTSEDSILDGIWVAGVYTVDYPTGTFPNSGGNDNATITVAANNASAEQKSGADYICDGTDDNVQIAAAIAVADHSIIYLVGKNFVGGSFTTSGCTVRGEGSGMWEGGTNNTTGTVYTLDEQSAGITVNTDGNIKDLQIRAHGSGQTDNTAVLTVVPDAAGSANAIDRMNDLLENIAVVDQSEVKTGIGLKFYMPITGAYIELSNIGPLHISGFNTGMLIDTSIGTTCFFNSNTFEHTTIASSKTAMLHMLGNGGIQNNHFTSLQLNAAATTEIGIKMEYRISTASNINGNVFFMESADMVAGAVFWIDTTYAAVFGNVFYGALAYRTNGYLVERDPYDYDRYPNYWVDTSLPNRRVYTVGADGQADFNNLSNAISVAQGYAGGGRDRVTLILVTDIDEYDTGITYIRSRPNVDIIGNGHTVRCVTSNTYGGNAIQVGWQYPTFNSKWEGITFIADTATTSATSRSTIDISYLGGTGNWESVWLWDNSTAAWVNNTTEADSAAGTPFELLAETVDYCYFGESVKWSSFWTDLDTLGSYTGLIWEYYDSDNWISITPVRSPTFAEDGMVQIAPADNWTAEGLDVGGAYPHPNTPPDTGHRYWLRVHPTTVVTPATVLSMTVSAADDTFILQNCTFINEINLALNHAISVSYQSYPQFIDCKAYTYGASNTGYTLSLDTNAWVTVEGGNYVATTQDALYIGSTSVSGSRWTVDGARLEGGRYSVNAASAISNERIASCTLVGPTNNITSFKELTIAAGVVTVSDESTYFIDTESDAATDNLATISGGYCGQVIYLRVTLDNQTVVVQHNVGNIWLEDKADFTLDDIYDCIALLFDGTKWISIAFMIPTIIKTERGRKGRYKNVVRKGGEIR